MGTKRFACFPLSDGYDYVESYNSRMRDELLDGELFLHVDEMKYVVKCWRMDYNHYRPYSSLSYITPAGFAELCRHAGCIRPHTPVLDGVFQFQLRIHGVIT